MDSTKNQGTSHDNEVVSSCFPIETVAAAGIFYHVQQLEQLVRRKVDECLKPEGLTADQFLALSLIVHQGPFSAAELARRTNVTAQSSMPLQEISEKLGFGD